MNSDFGFHQESSSPLILTVGSGTAGKHSDVAQGLVNTIQQVRPRKFRLVPSGSAMFAPVAERLAEAERT